MFGSQRTTRSLLIISAATAWFSWLFTTEAAAQFVKIDDFNSYLVGSSVDRQGWWISETASNPGADVVIDPLDAGNLALSIGQAGPDPVLDEGHREVINTSPLFAIPDANSATVYYRMYWEDGADHDLSIGLTEQYSPICDTCFNSYGSYESQLSLNGNATTQNLRARDAGSFDTISGDLSAGNWYDIWHVIDNASDTTRWYIQGGDFATQTLLDAGGQTDFLFRHSGGGLQSDPLRTFQLTTGNTLGPVLLDDVHIDNSGVNLSTPAAGLPLSVQPERLTATLSIDEVLSFGDAAVLFDGAPAGSPVTFGLQGTIDIEVTRLPGAAIEDSHQLRVLSADLQFAEGTEFDWDFGGGSRLVATFPENPVFDLHGTVPLDDDLNFLENRIELVAIDGTTEAELFINNVSVATLLLESPEGTVAAVIGEQLFGSLSFSQSEAQELGIELDLPFDIRFPVPDFPIDLILTGSVLATGTVIVPEPATAPMLLVASLTVLSGIAYRRR